MNRRIVRSFEYRMPAGFVCNLHALNDRVVAETLAMADNQVVLGVSSRNGKNRTLSLTEHPQRPELDLLDVFVLPPDVVAGQVDVLPAQR